MDRVLEYIAHHPWLVRRDRAGRGLVFAYEMRARSDGKVTVSPQELIRLMNQGALVLDLRPRNSIRPGTYGARQISGEQILKAADTLKKHKEKPVVVYDDNGALGGPAVRQLAAQGFTRAFALRGGLAAWRAENLPVSRA